MAANIVGVIIACRENWACVVKYVELISKAEEQISWDSVTDRRASFDDTVAHVSNEIRNSDLDEKNNGDTWMSPQLSTRNSNADMCL